MLQRVIYHEPTGLGRGPSLSNTLPLDTVRLLFAAFDDNRSVRAAAKIAVCNWRTAARYSRLWRRAREGGTSVDLKVNLIAVRPPAGLREAARARRCGAADLVTALLEAVLDGKLIDAILDGAALKVQRLRSPSA